MKPVVGIGIACLDHLLLVPEKSKDGGHVSDFRIEGGGLTATALVAAARLGAPTRLWCRVGDDEAGRAILRGLAGEGVDAGNVQVVAGARSPISVVHVDAQSGERTIFHHRGNCYENADEPPTLDGIEEAGALLVDPTWHAAAMAGARRARDARVPVIGDFHPSRDPELAALLDWLIVGEAPGRDLAAGQEAEDVLRHLCGFGPFQAAVTAGSKGCWYLVDEEVRHCAAFQTDVVDTTGAGDAFHGAFGFAIAQGWDVDRAVRLGCAVGALCCKAFGGRAALPDLATALALVGDSPA